MNRPCACCKHAEDCGWDSTCIDCQYAGTDKFEASGKCSTCRYDPRKHGVCGQCVDYDKYQPNDELRREETASGGTHEATN